MRIRELYLSDVGICVGTREVQCACVVPTGLRKLYLSNVCNAALALRSMLFL